MSCLYFDLMINENFDSSKILCSFCGDNNELREGCSICRHCRRGANFCPALDSILLMNKHYVRMKTYYLHSLKFKTKFALDRASKNFYLKVYKNDLFKLPYGVRKIIKKELDYPLLDATISSV